jgi:triose/dihydroxyacetone kinase / FAD-AMP lyase (cyclizing)
LPAVDPLVGDLVRRIAADRHLRPGDRVVALLGSAGATPPMELNIACRAVAATLEALGIDLVRIWQGLVMTSLDMAGISISLLRLPGGDAGAELLALLDAPTGSTAWPGRVPAEAPRMLVLDLPEADWTRWSETVTLVPR